MEPALPHWPRKRFEPGGGKAMVFFALYGKFPEPIQVSAEKYRTAGVPPGVRIKKVTRAEMPEFPFTGAGIGRLLQPARPGLFAEIQQAPECMIISGELEDPPDLNYLRDTFGLVMYFLESGAQAVLDPQKIALYSPILWRQEIFGPNPPELLNNAVLLVSPEAAGTKWLHTRGMRKFGRPDISFRGVESEQETAAIELCRRLIVLEGEGARVRDGEQFQADGFDGPLACRVAGDLEDPDFNNTHLEISVISR
jgi:hypothetical protein